jgi:phosphoglucosamine mutase
MTTRSLFGTDGIRGPFGIFPLDRPTVAALGVALAEKLAESTDTPTVVVGGDTRGSTPELSAWLASGLRAGGAGVRYLGTIPTPGVAFLARELGAACGVAISASHNPMPDNGIKLIDGSGFKWAPAAEAAIERRLLEVAESLSPVESDPVEPPEVEDELDRRYLEHLVASLPADGPLAGLEIILDCANGAASAYAPELFRRLGARVTALYDRPDGSNINLECGSTHPEALMRAVAGGSADLGIAFDGDADRALLVDQNGRLRDGDALLYLWGKTLAERDELASRTLVATSMSNLGLEVALREAGIDMVRCDVGDRVVVETMREHDLNLGGEQSGHIVHLGLATTGDGMLTALHTARIVRESGEPLSGLLDELPRFPQTLQNVRVKSRPNLLSLPTVAAAAAATERALGDRGRLVLRYSGTEPLARVMIEGPDQATIDRLAGDLISAIDREIGAA